MARFSVPGLLQLTLGQASSGPRVASSWGQDRRRTNSQTFREDFAEEEENINRFHEQEFVAEDSPNEEFRENYGVEDDNFGFHGDYRQHSEHDYVEEEDNDTEFYEYDDEDEHGVGRQGEENDEERQEKQLEEGNNGSASVTLVDSDVLDCPICYKPLIFPIFQCGNGHVACPSCCTKLNSICASCRCPVDYRSRAMEKVLESARAKCKNTKYGCKETMNYSKKEVHEKKCLYDPCSCPISDCQFVGPSSQLYQHFSNKHNNSAVGFSYYSFFHITAKADDKYFILQEENDKVLFIINNRQVQGFGNVVTVSCIASKSDELRLHYEIQAKDSSRLHCLKFQTLITTIQKVDTAHSPTRYLLVPSDFFSYGGQLELDIFIWGPIRITDTERCKYLF